MKIGRHFTFTQLTAGALIWVAVSYSSSVLALENSVATHLDHGKAAVCDCGMHSTEGECDHKQISAVTGFGETDPASQMTSQGTIHGRDGAAWKADELVGFAETEPASAMMSETTGIALVSVSSDDARQLGQRGRANSIQVHSGNDRVTPCNC